MDIISGIAAREGLRHYDLFDKYLAVKDAEAAKDRLNTFDVAHQKSRIKSLFSKVRRKNRIDQDFDEKPYFKYVKLDHYIDPLNKKEIHEAKLRGKINVEINEKLSPEKKVRAFANDYLSYYMHK